MKKLKTKKRALRKQKSEGSKDEQALLLPLSFIKPIKNIREKFEGIESLAESIRI